MGGPRVRQGFHYAIKYGSKAHTAYDYYNKSKYLKDRFVESLKHNKEMAKGYKRKRSKSFTRRPAKKSKGPAKKSSLITQQRDYNVTKRKRLSKKQVRWNKFVTKVRKAEAYNNAMACLTENNGTPLVANFVAGSFPNNTISRQCLWGVTANQTFDNGIIWDLRLGLYRPRDTLLLAGPKFLAQALQDQVNVEDTGAIDAKTISGSTAFEDYYIKGCSLTIAIQSAQTVSPFFIDIYEFVCTSSQSFSLHSNAMSSWIHLMSLSADAKKYGEPSADWTKSKIEFAGITPYHCPELVKYWKVVKKTRVLLNPRQTINYKMIGYKGKVHTATDAPINTYTHAGKTKDIVIIANPTYNPNAGATGAYFEVQWTKSYHLGMLDEKAGYQNPVTANVSYNA